MVCGIYWFDLYCIDMRISLNILNFVEIGRDSGGIIIIVVVDYMSVRILDHNFVSHNSQIL
jgi:hypothetical protein